MQHHLKRAGLFLLALLAVVCLLPNPASNAAASGPQQMYQRAWQLVRDGYYDPTYNHQDWEVWHHKFDGQLQTNEQAFDAVKKMLASLNDPYTRFLDPKAFKEEDDAINSVVVGIGISLRPFNEAKALVINDVIESGPAARAGLTFGDEIVSIDGQPTKDFDTEKAASKIRGKAGTPVDITVKRGTTQKSVHIVREQVSIPAVATKMLDHNIGYIKLATFMSDDASVEFRAALQKLSNTSGIVLDLRDNPGGLLANAIEIANMLMDHGKIVTTCSRHGNNTDSCDGNVLSYQPITILVDKDSASASEILAGALKDNGRAVVVGTVTYGKGLVQEINRLPASCGMHVTVARYLTPNGSDINKIGIKPDVSVEDRDKQLDTAIEVLQTKIANRNGGTNNGAQIMAAPPKRYGFGSLKSVSPRS